MPELATANGDLLSLCIARAQLRGYIGKGVTQIGQGSLDEDSRGHYVKCQANSEQKQLERHEGRSCGGKQDILLIVCSTKHSSNANAKAQGKRKERERTGAETQRGSGAQRQRKQHVLKRDTVKLPTPHISL